MTTITIIRLSDRLISSATVTEQQTMAECIEQLLAERESADLRECGVRASTGCESERRSGWTSLADEKGNPGNGTEDETRDKAVCDERIDLHSKPVGNSIRPLSPVIECIEQLLVERTADDQLITSRAIDARAGKQRSVD